MNLTPTSPTFHFLLGPNGLSLKKKVSLVLFTLASFAFEHRSVRGSTQQGTVGVLGTPTSQTSRL